MAPLFDCLTPAQGSPPAEVVLVHDVPGRLRFVAPVLKSEPDRAATLHTCLCQLDGVRAIRFNKLAGSVIVEYDTRTGTREAVLQALPDAGCRLVLRRSQALAPSGTTELTVARAVLTAIFHSVLNRAVETAIGAVI